MNLIVEENKRFHVIGIQLRKLMIWEKSVKLIFINAVNLCRVEVFFL